MNEDEFDDLLRRYLDDSISEQELDLFLNYISFLDNDVIIKRIDSALKEKDADQKAKMIPLLHSKRKKKKRVHIYAAASIALFIAIGLIWGRTALLDGEDLNAHAGDDILMAESEIMVRSSDGEVRVLGQKDSLYRLGALEINLDAAGQISYAMNHEKVNVNEEITIHIPKGKTSFLQLSDSSRVWLNSNSEIRFKTHFEKESRIVSLSGEAYFEVKHDESRPFIIHTETHDIEVLGTSFNVSSYRGMTAKTTLMDGSVRISHASHEAILKPSQQFSVGANGQTAVSQADVSETLAWRNGRFVFDRMHLKDLLTYLSNWYPIQEIEVDKWTNDVFTGTFTQDRSLKNILDKLAKTSSYEFQINDGRLHISLKQ